MTDPICVGGIGLQVLSSPVLAFLAQSLQILRVIRTSPIQGNPQIHVQYHTMPHWRASALRAAGGRQHLRPQPCADRQRPGFQRSSGPPDQLVADVLAMTDPGDLEVVPEPAHGKVS